MFDEAEFASGATFDDARFAGNASFAAVVFAQGVPASVEQQWELSLTRTEKEILNSISRGLPLKLTAQLLGMSPHSVDTLKRNLFRKLRMHNRAQALVAARELGLLDE